MLNILQAVNMRSTKMKVEIISKETIKPSSPTPTSSRNFKLSILEQLIPRVNGSLLYFFPSNNHQPPSQTSQNLKKSLSNTLTLYYPLAGKIVDNIMIDCNDNGALYIEAKVNISMSSFLQKPNGHDIYKFLPTKIEYSDQITGFITLVQVSFFSCGGIAIGLCVSHKLIDASSLGMFVKSWAGNMTGAETFPVYEASGLFPARKTLSLNSNSVENVSTLLPVRRLVFDSSKLAPLKAKFGATKSEIVTTIIWRSALKAARANSRSKLESVISRAANIRRRVSPPLSPNSAGNIIAFHTAITDQTDVDLAGLICALRKGLKVFDEMFVKKLKTEEAIDYTEDSARELARDDVEVYYCSSSCNIPLYDVDFGWGRPVWVTNPIRNMKNVIMLIDGNRGDGSVEAWVVFSEEDMCLFERDRELLAYASLDSSVVMFKSCM